MDQEKKHFQLFVIGGGSGGLSCARAAAGLGAKVGLADLLSLPLQEQNGVLEELV
jgi:glycerol-3-phosphate dehydrogenase